MADQADLVAESRTDVGKGASRRLRRDGKVPAIIYGAGKDPQHLTFNQNSVLVSMENEAFFSRVLTIDVDGTEEQAILKDVQPHPSRRQILHLDLQRIVADEEIRMTVPIHFVNEETAIGVKQGGGSVSHLMTEVEITCLPRNLPEYLELDIAELELDASLHLSDIKLPSGVEVPELAQEDGDRAVVSIHVIKEVVEEEPEAEEAEGEEAGADEDNKEEKDED